MKLRATIIKSLNNDIVDIDLIILCTPMSEYKGLISNINRFISRKTLITDIGSSKIETSKIIKKFLKERYSLDSKSSYNRLRGKRA